MTEPTLYSVARRLLGLIVAWSPTVPESGELEWTADEIALLRRVVSRQLQERDM